MPARWEPAERHVVHVARSEFELPWKQIAMIFGDIFKVDWKGTALPKDSQLRQEYQGRKAKMWTQVIIKDEYTSEEKAVRQWARDGIEKAAGRLSIALVAKSASGSAAGTTPIPTSTSGPSGTISSTNAAQSDTTSHRQAHARHPAAAEHTDEQHVDALPSKLPKLRLKVASTLQQPADGHVDSPDDVGRDAANRLINKQTSQK